MSSSSIRIDGLDDLFLNRFGVSVCAAGQGVHENGKDVDVSVFGFEKAAESGDVVYVAALGEYTPFQIIFEPLFERSILAADGEAFQKRITIGGEVIVN